MPALVGRPRQSLDTAAARNLATTTKSVPQMRGISPRWLLRVLPWVEVSGGTYRVNRRLCYPVGDGRVGVSDVAGRLRVIPQELCELPALRGFDDADTLQALADRFTQREYAPGETIAESGHPIGEVLLIGYGKATRLGTGRYGDRTVLGVLGDGDPVGAAALVDPQAAWDHSLRALTRCTVLALPVTAFTEIAAASPELTEHLERVRTAPQPRRNRKGEAAIEVASGHYGEPDLPGTYVDYEARPREYPLTVAQTVLQVHTRVADLYNDPMDQAAEQLRLTVEAMRERQEYELVNNPEVGLLPGADPRQRIPTRDGPPTPDDLDELLTRRRKTRYFLAHPRTIAAFGRECSRRGVYPQTVTVEDAPAMAWRGVPVLPCDKIPISERNTSAILAMRTGEADEGVIGLRPATLPDEHEPGLSVRFTGIDEKAIISYLVSAYYSVAVLVPDALGVLENVELGR